MPAPLLSTKLYIPPLRATLVSRPRLIERLNTESNCKLTLISAPAGFGKTTLLSSWVSDCQMPVAWVSLDEGDNDLMRFLAYVTAALQKIEPGIGKVTLSLFESLQAPQIEAALTTLLNEIAGLPARFALIFDDYHTINAQSVHDAMTFILDHLPPQMSLVISTRSDPPLPIARLRASGQLTELRQNDLRFTPDETVRFLSQVMQLDLTAEGVAALLSRTEGWIAGLQMVALSMRNHEDVSGFIARFTGSQHHILDYLVEEVLKRQPEVVQDFLLQTSILDRMSGPLCDAVTSSLTPRLPGDRTGEKSSQAMLEYLEHANLFVFPLDEDLHWYRYHHLFADCLERRLYQEKPELVSELHRRAAGWYEQNSFISEAVSHLLTAGDWTEAARLVEQSALRIFTRGEMSTLLAWLDKLPDELVRDRPWLCIFHAWALHIGGRYESVAARLQAAEQAIERAARLATQVKLSEESVTSEAQMRAHIAAIRAFEAVIEEKFAHAIGLARQALEHLPEVSVARALMVMALGRASRLSGDLETANQAFGEAKRIGQTISFTYAAVSATCSLAYHHKLQGRLHQSAENYQEALFLANGKSEQRPAVAGYAQVQLSDIQREWNDLETALRYVKDGLDLCSRAGCIGDLARGYVTLARIYLAQNDLDGARRALQNTGPFTRMAVPDFLILRWVQDCQVRLWLAEGNLVAATQWMQTSGLKVTDELSFRRELEHITLARVLIAQGQTYPEGSYLTDAISLLARLLEAAESKGWTGQAIEIMVLQALALQAQNQLGPAQAVLIRALTLAEPEGYVRIFVDEGAPMASLLRQAAHSSAPAYVSNLLTAFGKQGKVDGSPRQAGTPDHAMGLVEPLSQRELEVLRLLPTDLSSVDIANELCVSSNTARSHIRHIYSKLNVHGRYEAIARARELELL